MDIIAIQIHVTSYATLMPIVFLIVRKKLGIVLAEMDMMVKGGPKSALL
jgi:hypothetical protein